MLVSRIVDVRTGRRLGVEAQRRVVELPVADLARVEAHDGELLRAAEEFLPGFFTRPVPGLVRERLEQRHLLRLARFDERMSKPAAALVVEPGEARAQRLLLLGVVGHHEIDEFGDARFARARRIVARNDQLREALDAGIFLAGEILRRVRLRTRRRWLVALMRARIGPSHEARKVGGDCRNADGAQELPALDVLSGHWGVPPFRGESNQVPRRHARKLSCRWTVDDARRATEPLRLLAARST